MHIGGLLGNREPRGRRNAGAGSTAGRESGLLPISYLTCHSKRKGQALGDLGFDIRTQVIAVVIEIFDITGLVHITQRSEIIDPVAAARRSDAVLLERTGSEDFVDPVGVAPAVRAFAHHLYMLGREDRLLTVEFERLVVPVSITRTVEEFGIRGIERRTVGPFVSQVHRTLSALLGRYDHHTAGCFETVNRYGGAVLQQRYRLHIVGVDVIDRTLHAVDDIENTRLRAANGHAGLVLTGLSGILHRDKTRQTAGQSLRDIGHRHLLKFLTVDLRHGRRNVGTALRAVTEDDDLVQTGGILLHRNVKVGNPPPTSYSL